MTISIARGAFAFAATALVLGTIAPAYAADPAPMPKPRSQAQKVCVQGSLTGTRLPRTVCKTRGEWLSQDGYDPSASHGAR
jgi:hypothetical protein